MRVGNRKYKTEEGREVMEEGTMMTLRMDRLQFTGYSTWLIVLPVVSEFGLIWTRFMPNPTMSSALTLCFVREKRRGSPGRNEKV